MPIPAKWTSFNNILIFLELGFRRSVIIPIGHEAIQTFVPYLDILADRAFDQYDDLQCDLEKEQVRFNSFGRVQVDRFKLVPTFGPAMGVLHFILVFMGHHRIFYRQLGRGFVGYQRIFLLDVRMEYAIIDFHHYVKLYFQRDQLKLCEKMQLKR